MSLAVSPASTVGRSWWTTRPKSDSREPVRARSKTISDHSAIPSTSRFTALASAIGFKPKHTRHEIPQVDTRHPPPSPRQNRQTSSFSPDEVSSEGPLTPITDSKSNPIYDPFAHIAQTSLPKLSHTPPGSTYTLKLQKPLPRPRALTETRPSTSPRSSGYPISALARSPTSSIRSSSISTSAETSVIFSDMGLSRQNTTASSVWTKKGSIFSPSEDNHDLALRGSTRQKLERLPSPKAPPERILPPTPIASLTEENSSSFPITKTKSEVPRGLTRSQLPSVPVLFPPSPTPPNDSQRQHPSLLAESEQRKNTSQSQPGSVPSKAEARHSKDSASKERRRVTSDASLKSSGSHDGTRTPKKQRSFHNIIPPSSFLPSLRHATSFTPPVNDDEPTTAAQTPETRPTSQQGSPQKSSSQKGRRRLFAGSGKHADGSDKGSSIGTQRAGEGHEDDSRSVFSLPSDLNAGHGSEWAYKVSSKAPKAQPSTTADHHILPPDELMQLMEGPSERPVSQRRSAHASSKTVTNALPTRSKSLQSVNLKSSSQTPRGSISSTAAAADDAQDVIALCPRPRKPIGTIRRRRPSVSRSGSRSVTPPKMPEQLELQRSVSKSTLRDTDAPRMRLTRTASFLTLDDDENIKPHPAVHQKYEPRPSAGWESDATEEQDSFFDFGRGMNSIDSAADDIFD